MKIIVVFPNEAENTSTSDLSKPLLIIYPKDDPSYHKGTCSTILIMPLFIKAQNWKQPRSSSIEEWIKKMHIYTLEYNSVVEMT